MTSPHTLGVGGDAGKLLLDRRTDGRRTVAHTCNPLFFFEKGRENSFRYYSILNRKI